MSSSALIAVSGLLYIIAMVFYTGFLFFNKRAIGRAATFLAIIGIILHVSAFGMRFEELYIINGGGISKSLPISNLYESLQFFALLLMAIYLIFELKSGSRMFGAFASAIAGAALLFIDAVGAPSGITPIVPVLQSNWLLAHVSLSFIAYVFFALSAITAFIYLVLMSNSRREFSYILWTVILGLATAGLLGLIFDAFIAFFNGDLAHIRLFSATLRNNLTIVRLMFILLAVLTVFLFWYYGKGIKSIFGSFGLDTGKLDILTYKFAVMGFAIFTIGGLLFGAVWAEQAWGRYWSWDPKETWAFLTWLTYLIYLHGRIYAKWNKKLSNSIALFGFIMTIFTYVGVNLLLSGLHSYGAI